MTKLPWEYLFDAFEKRQFPDLFDATWIASLLLLIVLVILYNVRTKQLHAHRPFLDLYESWAALAGAGSNAATAFGLMADSLHPSQFGHDEIAACVGRIVLAAGD